MRRYFSNQLEPSRLRATIVAGLALAASLGLIGTTSMPAWADGALAVFAVLWPTVQHVLVRPVVTPVAKIAAAIEADPNGYLVEDSLRAKLIDGTAPIV